MNFDAIRQYWEERASGDSSAQSTTQDFYLREIELTALSERIDRYAPAVLADVGCGDGRTTAQLASRHPKAHFTGFDYSTSMIENARRVNDVGQAKNLRFESGDVSEGLKESFNLIYTTRCLINLPSWDLQKTALKNIHRALTADGVYVMVENFVEGHANLNQVRKRFGLAEISIRQHNCFFERERLLNYVEGMFVVEEEINISSTYYLVSRVIYSKLCADAGISPDYFDAHHKLATALPFLGEFGPVRLVSLKKRRNS